MTLKTTLGRLTLAAVLATGGAAFAETPGFDASFKVRAAGGLATHDDGLSRKGFGFGFDLGYGTDQSRFGLELGYQYKPGTQYMKSPAAMPVAPGQSVDPSQFVDSRKSQLGGVLVRLGYEQQLGVSPWSWRVGLQAGGSKFRQEYVGDVTDGVSYEDTYNGVATVSKLSVSPYLGVAYALDATQGLELNLLGLRYTSADYVHTAGTVANAANPPQGGHTSWDVVSTRNRTTPTLEFVYVLRF